MQGNFMGRWKTLMNKFIKYVIPLYMAFMAFANLFMSNSVETSIYICAFLMTVYFSLLLEEKW